jgi:hypothetical protein
MKQLQAFGIGLVTIGLILTIGLQVLSTLGGNLETEEIITGESDINDTQLPDNYTLDESNDDNFLRVKQGSVTVEYRDASAGTTETLTQGFDFFVFNDQGLIRIQDTETFLDLDSSEDEFLTDYTAVNADETARQGSNDTITGITELSSFLPILALVAAAAVVIGLVSGRIGGARRGRA